jgi:hypothetical protein
MRLPGFTAEEALGMQADFYQEAVIAADPAESGLIVPQTHRCWLCEWDPWSGLHCTWGWCGPFPQ